MPTTTPEIRTNNNTRVIPFFRSEFSPKKWPTLNRKPTKKMTPNTIGKMFRMVSEISFTEFSIPPICAKRDVEESVKKVIRIIDFFIINGFKFLFIPVMRKLHLFQFKILKIR